MLRMTPLDLSFLLSPDLLACERTCEDMQSVSALHLLPVNEAAPHQLSKIDAGIIPFQIPNRRYCFGIKCVGKHGEQSPEPPPLFGQQVVIGLERSFDRFELFPSFPEETRVFGGR